MDLEVMNSTALSSNASDDDTDSAVIEQKDFDIFGFLAGALGPQRQPPEKLIPLTIIYIGNCCAIGAMLREGAETTRYYRTPCTFLERGLNPDESSKLCLRRNIRSKGEGVFDGHENSTHS